MCAHWKEPGRGKRVQPKALVDFLIQLSRKDDVLPLESFASILLPRIKFSDGVPESECRAAVRQAIAEEAALKRPDAKRLLGRVTRHENAYMTRDETSWFVLGSVSIVGSVPLRPRRLIRCGFSFPKKVSSTLRDEHARVAQKLGVIRPDGYRIALAKLKARSAEEAGERAIEAFDFLRGLWNFALNSGLSVRYGSPSPINRIIPGPIYTVHRSDGTTVPAPVFLGPAHIGLPPASYDPGENWSLAMRIEKEARRVVRRSSYSEILTSAFRGYCRALDTMDFERSILSLWALVERLTCTDEELRSGSVNQKTCRRRLAFMQSPADVVEDVAYSLSQSRNIVAHTFDEVLDPESQAYVLKWQLERLMRFHLGANPRFRSFGQAIEVLSSPRDLDRIETEIARTSDRRRALQRATSYRELDPGT